MVSHSIHSPTSRGDKAGVCSPVRCNARAVHNVPIFWSHGASSHAAGAGGEGQMFDFDQNTVYVLDNNYCQFTCDISDEEVRDRGSEAQHEPL